MLNVTDEAKVYLKGLIDQNNVPEEATIRLTAGPQGLGLAPDKATEADTAYEHDGRTVLVVAEQISTQLDGKSLSVNETEQGMALAIA